MSTSHLTWAVLPRKQLHYARSLSPLGEIRGNIHARPAFHADPNGTAGIVASVNGGGSPTGFQDPSASS